MSRAESGTSAKGTVLLDAGVLIGAIMARECQRLATQLNSRLPRLGSIAPCPVRSGVACEQALANRSEPRYSR